MQSFTNKNKIHKTLLSLLLENIQAMLNGIQTKKLESYDCVLHFFCIFLDEVSVDHF